MKKLIIGFLIGVALTVPVMMGIMQPGIPSEELVPTPEIVYVTPTPMPTPTPQVIYKERLTDLEQVIENVKGACVMVYAHMPDGSTMQSSGWIYNKRIVTVKHGVVGAERIDVFLDGSSTGAKGYIHYMDDELDLAVLEFDRIADSVTLGDSGKLKDGEKVIGIVSPQGSQNMIDECIYSGTDFADGEYILNISESIIDPGASGGAIFNYDSELVGMVFKGGNTTGVAIPINEIKPILENLN